MTVSVVQSTPASVHLATPGVTVMTFKIRASLSSPVKTLPLVKLLAQQNTCATVLKATREIHAVKLVMPALSLSRVSMDLVHLILAASTPVSASLDSQERIVMRILMTVLVVNVSTVPV